MTGAEDVETSVTNNRSPQDLANQYDQQRTTAETAWSKPFASKRFKTKDFTKILEAHATSPCLSRTIFIKA